MSVTARQIRAQLQGMFPPGSEKVIDWQDEPGELLQVVAETVKVGGFDRLDVARRETNPLTADAMLPRYENALGLSGSIIATLGTKDQRRAQVISRIRGKGAPTVAKVQAVVAPVLDYADPSTLVVVETSRSVLRMNHTRIWLGSLPFTMAAATITWVVADRAKVSKGGAQVDVTIAHPDLSQVAATLVAPDGRTRTVTQVGRGVAAGTYRLYFAGMAGAQVAGTWTLNIGAITGAGTITQADLFVEGVGRELGLDGLGAAMGFWGVVADPALMGPNGSISAANEAINFINYATRNGRTIRKSTIAPATCVCPDETAAIPDECIPC